MPDPIENIDALLNEHKENLKVLMHEYNEEFNKKLRIIKEQCDYLMKDSQEIDTQLKEIDERLERLMKDLKEINQDTLIISDKVEKIEKQAIKNNILNTPDIRSTPWDPWEGFLDTMYLSGCYIVEFWDLVVKAIKKLLDENASKSKELLDKESDSSHKFSFCSIFSKDNDKPNAVPYTGEYQCSLKMK